MEKVLDIECLDKKIQEIMREHFGHCSSDYHMSLMLFKEEPDADRNDRVKNTLKNQKLKVCAIKKISVTDCRIGSDGRSKVLYWVMACQKECEANKVLAEVILDEVAPKFYDMVHIESMGELKQSEDLAGKSKEKFYCGVLRDLKWLLDKYVQKVIDSNSLPDPLDLIQLSAQPYEGRSAKTQIIFSNNSIPPGLKNAVYFNADDNNATDSIIFKTDNLMTIRKLMEISGENSGLWVKLPEKAIQGSIDLTNIQYGYAETAVKFKGNSKWSVSKDNKNILLYRMGKYHIPDIEPEQAENAYFEKLEQFGDKLDTAMIKKIIEKFSEVCKHGTSIVFMDNDGLTEEIDARLYKYKRALKVKSFSLENAKPDFLQGISAIDGAIFADLSGMCHAVGVIVDGEMIEEGDYGRGARYNSLRNYVTVYHNKYPEGTCLAVVISEDGMINVIC